MIKLKRLNHSEVILNCEIIELIEETPDTVITLVNGHKIVVKETADEIIEKVIAFKKKIHAISQD
ncbi:flagellar FlbD family protein [Clostridium formicaceticum]|uniref:Flagellar protein (FlbD) n=1 Tax=Clostridium formicaceticum TaxID=1497 RepID=A0AAC9WGI3_9CLOT|nr:flagellar FlbD family protein [Clostridium formicaceticum]AOY77313.1 flagellar protein FlbD [Clostridium formicaceticum]ARE87856.1 Flagellar protein (FlbD) [Clostridium formicaceticum]